MSERRKLLVQQTRQSNGNTHAVCSLVQQNKRRRGENDGWLKRKESLVIQNFVLVKIPCSLVHVTICFRELSWRLPNVRGTAVWIDGHEWHPASNGAEQSQVAKVTGNQSDLESEARSGGLSGTQQERNVLGPRHSSY